LSYYFRCGYAEDGIRRVGEGILTDGLFLLFIYCFQSLFAEQLAERKVWMEEEAKMKEELARQKELSKQQKQQPLKGRKRAMKQQQMV
jgi:hypothetical protein